MRVFKVSICVLSAIIICVIFNVIFFNNFTNRVTALIDETERFFDDNKSEEAQRCISEIEGLIKESKPWFSVTLDTPEIERLELSVERLKKFAQMEKNTDVYGELIILKKEIDSLPYKEGLSWGVIL